jgi:hypothetical protein
MIEYSEAHRPFLAVSLRAERSNLGPLALDIAEIASSLRSSQ